MPTADSPTPRDARIAAWLTTFEYQGNQDWQDQLAELTDMERRAVLTIALCSGGHWSGDLAVTIRLFRANFG